MSQIAYLLVISKICHDKRKYFVTFFGRAFILCKLFKRERRWRHFEHGNVNRRQFWILFWKQLKTNFDRGIDVLTLITNCYLWYCNNISCIYMLKLSRFAKSRKIRTRRFLEMKFMCHSVDISYCCLVKQYFLYVSGTSALSPCILMALNLYNHQYVDYALIYFALKPCRTKLDYKLILACLPVFDMNTE